MAKTLKPGQDILRTKTKDGKFRDWTFAGFFAPNIIGIHYFNGSLTGNAYTFCVEKGTVINLPANGALSGKKFKILEASAKKNEIVVEEWDGQEDGRGDEARRTVRA